MINFAGFDAITFDCYGTLIDWETGILNCLRPLLAGHGRHLADAQILEAYSELEPAAQSGTYVPYRQVLEEVVRGMGQRFGFSVSTDEANNLAASVKNWLPFPDTVAALRALKGRYRLGVISNADDDLFVASARHLQVSFNWVITAEQARAYKPSRQIFDFALGRIGLSPEKIVHAGQSLFHDVVPAKAMGMSTVLVKRRGFGAVKPIAAEPDLAVPDLKTLAEIALAAARTN